MDLFSVLENFKHNNAEFEKVFRENLIQNEKLQEENQMLKKNNEELKVEILLLKKLNGTSSEEKWKIIHEREKLLIANEQLENKYNESKKNEVKYLKRNACLLKYIRTKKEENKIINHVNRKHRIQTSDDSFEQRLKVPRIQSTLINQHFVDTKEREILYEMSDYEHANNQKPSHPNDDNGNNNFKIPAAKKCLKHAMRQAIATHAKYGDVKNFRRRPVATYRNAMADQPTETEASLDTSASSVMWK